MKKISPRSLLIVLLLSGACGLRPPIADGSWTAPLDILAEPAQEPHEGEGFFRYFPRGQAHLQPVARYRLNGILKGKRAYRKGWNSRLSPMDLVVIWGELTSPEYDRLIQYRQRNRWYYYRFPSGFPQTRQFIVRHSSNNHIIPATDNLRRLLRTFRKGQVLSLEGYLVNINATAGHRRFWWNTSRSREDSGDGSCEIIYLTRVITGGKIYH